MEEEKENTQRGKPISERKRQANRANSRQSTGPKTARGKAITRWNAFRHGAFAKLDINEGKHMAGYEEYQKFLAQLEEQCQPKTLLEWIPLQNLAMAYWRLMRANHIELQTTETKDVWANEWFDRLLRYSNLAQRHWQSAWEALQRALAQSAMQPSATEPEDKARELAAAQAANEPEDVRAERSGTGDLVAAAQPTNSPAQPGIRMAPDSIEHNAICPSSQESA